ncbi:MAG TPA: class I SAM-dependent methyltransferase [Candidatus Methylomirabilis sp.]|nr:class I SAM-dependent methyltransferase [Candidatus Methylomirabilis sp.]
MIKVNHEYVVYIARQLKERSGNLPDFKGLDYGCGAGEVVEMALALGVQMSGVDVFCAGSKDKEIVKEKGQLWENVFSMADGRIPYPDKHFDLVIANQVLEHVADLESVISEIARVLKPGGHLLALLPTKGNLWEAHMSLPLAHWFPKGSKARVSWVFAWRCLGFGDNKDGKSRWEWTKHVLSWLDTYCFYRSRQEIQSSLGAFFDVTSLEREYIKFRKRKSWRWRILAPFPKTLGAGVNATIFRMVAGSVFLARKKPSGYHIPRKAW